MTKPESSEFDFNVRAVDEAHYHKSLQEAVAPRGVLAKGSWVHVDDKSKHPLPFEIEAYVNGENLEEGGSGEFTHRTNQDTPYYKDSGMESPLGTLRTHSSVTVVDESEETNGDPEGTSEESD
jgi:hypothetical protein